jgi:hypothetical protein
MNTILGCLALAAAALLTACGGGSLSTEQGHLRLVNATSNFASLDLFAAGNPVVTGVAPLTASGYGDIDRNSYSLDVRATGSGVALVTTSTTIARKEHQTVVASTSGGTLTATVLSDQEGDPSSGNAKLRIFNTASSDAGNVDVYLVAGGCDTLATSGAAPIASNVSGLQSGYTQIGSSATAYHVCVTAPGDKTDLRLDLPSLVLSEKRIVTLILVRGAGGFLLDGLVLDQQGALVATQNTSARVRVAASVSPARAVAVDVNGTTVAAALGTPGLTPYRLVPAGALTVKVDGTVLALPAAASATPGGDFTLLLTGPTPTATLIADDNSASSSATRPVRLRLVNGLNGVPGTVSLSVNSGIVADSVPFAGASAYTLQPASAALTTIEADAGVVVLAKLNGVTLTSAGVYTLFLLGDYGSAPPNAGLLSADR